jgi:4'-phosphopantetheinyl transferase EntD
MAPLPTSQQLFVNSGNPVTAVLVSAEPTTETPIDPDEFDCLSEKASPKRRHQFLLGRHASRVARSLMGTDHQSPIRKDKKGQPIWPDGLVGSISHTGTLACCAVARSAEVRAIGIDVETVRLPRQENLPERIFVEPDLEWIFAKTENSSHRFTTLFSACESIFKCVSPLTANPPHFKDVRFQQHSEETLEVLWLENRTGLSPELLPVEVQVETTANAVVTLCVIDIPRA